MIILKKYMKNLMTVYLSNQYHLIKYTSKIIVLTVLLVIVKKHKNIFKNVLKKIISVNKVYTCNNIFIYDECKKLHKGLFNKLISRTN